MPIADVFFVAWRMCFIENTNSALWCASPLEAVTSSLSPYQTMPPRWEPSFAKSWPPSVGTVSSTQRYFNAPGSFASTNATRASPASSLGPFAPLCVHPDRITLSGPHFPSSSASPDVVTDWGSQSCVTASPWSQQYAADAFGFRGSAAASVPAQAARSRMGWLALFSTSCTPTLGSSESRVDSVLSLTRCSVSPSFARSAVEVSGVSGPGLSPGAARAPVLGSSAAPSASSATAALRAIVFFLVLIRTPGCRGPAPSSLWRADRAGRARPPVDVQGDVHGRPERCQLPVRCSSAPQVHCPPDGTWKAPVFRTAVPLPSLSVQRPV